MINTCIVQNVATCSMAQWYIGTRSISLLCPRGKAILKWTA